MIKVLNLLGLTLAKTPEFVLNGLCVFLGWAIYYFPFGRIRVSHSNLSHAFPNMSAKERKKIVFESSRRMVEMGMFVLASPHISAEKLKERVVLSDYLLEQLKEQSQNPKPLVLMIPHFCMMETITMFPLLTDIKIPKTGVFYRPFDNPAIEKWVRDSRERFGIDLLSRKKSLLSSMKYLREDGCVAILFDQMVQSGTVSLCLDRVCRTSEFPGLLVENTKADCGAFWATRTGFWRSKIDCYRFTCDKTIEDITYTGDKWLSEKLTNDPIARYDWLWLHKRWKMPVSVNKLLKLTYNKNIIDFTLGKRGLKELPRVGRIFISAPDSLRSTIAIFPLIKALRDSRPDCSVTILCQEKHFEIIKTFDVADNVISIPNRNKKFARLLKFYKLRESFADIHLVLNDSLIDDFEARIMNAEFRFAISNSRKRLFMKSCYKPDKAHSAEHIFFEYKDFMENFGLDADIDFSPIKIGKAKQNQNALVENDSFSKDNSSELTIAIICSKTGNCSWTVEKWVEFIKAFSEDFGEIKFKIFGDFSEPEIVANILKSIISSVDIQDLTPNSSMVNYMQKLLDCDIAVGVDCDTMHIANALGLKSVALYGATNLIRNGFVFNTSRLELTPKGCPIQGGGNVADINVDDVIDAIFSIR